MIRKDRHHEARREPGTLVQLVEGRDPDLDAQRFPDLARVHRAHLGGGIDDQDTERLLRFGETCDRGQDVLLPETRGNRLFDGLPELAGHAGLQGGPARPGFDEHPGAGADNHVAGRSQIAVGGGDRVRVNLELARPGSNRRKPGAAGKFAGKHGELDLGADLILDRDARIPPDPDLHGEPGPR